MVRTFKLEASTSSDEQEDSSSSLTNKLLKTRDALEKLSLANVQVTEGEDELAAFRQQWQRELEATPSPHREPPRQQTKLEPEEPVSDEEKAKQLFLRGVELERSGKLYEAIQHYKRSMQICPDVETRLYESTDHRADTPIEELKVEEVREVEDVDSDDEMIEGEDLVTRLQRILARKGTLCQPEFTTRGGHISWLPYEVVQLVLRWAVSADLDAVTLERISATCRGLYLAAREPDIWRLLCVKTWGIECGVPRGHGFTSWRQMYIDRPRIHLHGCYISKTTYLRHGENSYQDQSYRPWYLVDYYRYLRFFPDGVVLMWTTAEEPASCVGQLKHRAAKPSLGIMPGHYRLVGDKVVIVIKKVSSEKKPAHASNTRFRSRRKETLEHHEQIFHLELELHNVRSRRNWQLSWRHYAVSSRRDQWTQFDLTPNKFPPFAFSRVRAYTAEAHAPLASHTYVHALVHTFPYTYTRTLLHV
ncbi:F-box only protein 9 [Papilio xuthus]|uniref:F-box only protein 9 n=1 Tax=Papilio xuthus TaxID=66420 RepID=A0A194Q1Q0_PAPXU|nr:F-box only protein 9 [Papilio xuthus]